VGGSGCAEDIDRRKGKRYWGLFSINYNGVGSAPPLTLQGGCGGIDGHYEEYSEGKWCF